MEEVLCPICRHTPGDHDAEGRCSRPACGCLIDRERAFNPRFYDRRRTWLDRVSDAALERPFLAFILVSLVPAACALLIDWLTNRYAANVWVKAHTGALTAVEHGLFVYGAFR